MNFWDVFGEMLVILFAIAAGYAANRLGYLGGEADQKVSKLLLNITMPAMIVAAVITGEELPELGTILSILEVGVVFYLLEAVFALVVPRFLPGTQGQKGVWRYALAFPNVGFIGYPVAVALFGDGALFYAAILALPFNLLSYSLGPLLLAGGCPLPLEAAVHPCIVASVLGLVLALTRLRPPALVGEMLDFVGRHHRAAVPAGGGLPAGGHVSRTGAALSQAVAADGHPPAVAAGGPVPGPPGAGDRLPGAGDRCHPDGHARSSERDAAEHGVRRRHRVHGTDHLPDHGGVHRDHSHRRRAAALSLERKPICLTFNNWSPT